MVCLWGPEWDIVSLAESGSHTSDFDRRLPCGAWRWVGGPGASSLARLLRFLLGDAGDITTVIPIVYIFGAKGSGSPSPQVRAAHPGPLLSLLLVGFFRASLSGPLMCPCPLLPGGTRQTGQEGPSCPMHFRVSYFLMPLENQNLAGIQRGLGQEGPPVGEAQATLGSRAAWDVVEGNLPQS